MISEGKNMWGKVREIFGQMMMMMIHTHGVVCKSSGPSLFLGVVIILSLTGSYLKMSEGRTSSCSRKPIQIADSPCLL